MHKTSVSLFIFLAASSSSMAQLDPEVSFCPAGVQADGFVNWTKLPAAPVSGAVNAKIPVSGVPNLFMTFQTSGQAIFPPNGGYYRVINPTDLSLDLGINPTFIFRFLAQECN
jgi:hypothetical protein